MILRWSLSPPLSTRPPPRSSGGSADAQFAADVSHELRSPLTAILGAVAVIGEHRSSLPPLGIEMVRLLEVEVGRFARLVEDLLEISRLDSGSAELTLEDASIGWM